MYEYIFKLLAAVEVDTSPLPRAGLDNNVVIDIFNIVFGLLAGIAFVSIVYGGFKYVISQGEPDKIGKAKDIILYSIIGLVISLSAFGIVNVFIKAIT
jgi:hypothetical protein